ncbi:hypothetical protein GCM10010430_21700 [Kitasatospora cystarginea]|uniref:Uncharacterized protein n=1 Tax=Kitasatospora cystarginea TaxID=58350 RepID=A0ABN3DRE3_9ACTN
MVAQYLGHPLRHPGALEPAALGRQCAESPGTALLASDHAALRLRSKPRPRPVGAIRRGSPAGREPDTRTLVGLFNNP